MKVVSYPTCQELEVHYNIPEEEALHRVLNKEALGSRTSPCLEVEGIALKMLNYKAK